MLYIKINQTSSYLGKIILPIVLIYSAFASTLNAQLTFTGTDITAAEDGEDGVYAGDSDGDGDMDVLLA